MKKILLALLIAAIGIIVWKRRLFTPAVRIGSAPEPSPSVHSLDFFAGVGYVPVDPGAFSVSVLASGLSAPTRLRLTPDGRFLLVTQISGEVFAFRRLTDGWSNEPLEILTIDTKFPGFPPDEAGLVGLVIDGSSDDAEWPLYLLYTYEDQDGPVRNRISRSVIRKNADGLVAENAAVIYQANVPGSSAHQITDAAVVDRGGKPHLLFLIGDGYDGKRAQDPTLESGKLILIQADGSDPLGPRPFAGDPKVQALGVRNGFVLAKNPFDAKARFFITDTGPDRFDRVLYTDPFGQSPLNFSWDGNESSLESPLKDPNDPRVTDMAIVRLPETRTFTGLAVHPGRGAIPESTGERQSVLVTVFGKTGWQSNEPGKQIWLGQLTNLDGQPQLSFEPIVVRNLEAEGKYGNPIGLEIDPLTGDFFFADIMEGRIYQVKIL